MPSITSMDQLTHKLQLPPGVRLFLPYIFCQVAFGLVWRKEPSVIKVVAKIESDEFENVWVE